MAKPFGTKGLVKNELGSRSLNNGKGNVFVRDVLRPVSKVRSRQAVELSRGYKDIGGGSFSAGVTAIPRSGKHS